MTSVVLNVVVASSIAVTADEPLTGSQGTMRVK